MILITHLLIGAVIAVKVNFLPLAILFAFLSHYLLDSLPHNDYSIENIKNKRWRKSGTDFLKLILDMGTGLIVIIFICYFAKITSFTLFIVAFFAILPDALIFLRWALPNSNSKILNYHFNFHQKIHFPKNKKISSWLKIFMQLLVILTGFAFLL